MTSNLIYRGGKSASVLAAILVIETGCSYASAGKQFGISHGPVAKAYRRLMRKRRGLRAVEPAPPPPDPDYSRMLARAVAFVRNHATTVRRAAEVYGVDRFDLLDAYNKATGERRQFVGEAAPRLTLTQLGKAGNREANYIETGSVR